MINNLKVAIISLSILAAPISANAFSWNSQAFDEFLNICRAFKAELNTNSNNPVYEFNRSANKVCSSQIRENNNSGYSNTNSETCLEHTYYNCPKILEKL